MDIFRDGVRRRRRHRNHHPLVRQVLSVLKQNMSSFIWSDNTVEHIQDLSVEVLERVSVLSKRGRDAFLAFYYQCGEDMATMAYTLMLPDFAWDRYHSGIGGKTRDELSGFSSEILELLGRYKDTPGLEEWDVHQKKARIARCGISGKDVDIISELEQSLGYFPTAAFVLKWMSSRNERDFYIYRHGFSVWRDPQEESLLEMACNLGITTERCRQVRNILFADLLSLMQGLALEDACPYDCFCRDLDSRVNGMEGTDFNVNFIRFILGSSYSSLSSVGNIEDALLVRKRGGTGDAFVAAVPESVAASFDVNAFLAETESLNGEKSTETRYGKLPEWNLEAGNLAAKLVDLRYGWKVTGESFVIPPNADKNRSDIMEDIIRDADRPLSMEEIVAEYSRRYPDRQADPAKIRGNMQVNPRIVPIGRSGVYSLEEWTSGSARGGTIRSFVRECLDRSETHIVPSREVCEYVRRFRPSSSDENIISNLMLETEKSFRVIWKDGVSYLSYSAEPIPEGYRQIVRSVTDRRSFEESISLLDGFISRFGRMPKVCDNPEESRLARFLSNVRSLRRRGMLTEDELSELCRIESRLSDGSIQLQLF